MDIHVPQKKKKVWISMSKKMGIRFPVSMSKSFGPGLSIPNPNLFHHAVGFCEMVKIPLKCMFL